MVPLHLLLTLMSISFKESWRTAVGRVALKANNSVRESRENSDVDEIR